MNIDSYIRLIPESDIKPEIVFAAHVLEGHGLRFGVDFGFTNAIEKATDLTLKGLENVRR